MDREIPGRTLDGRTHCACTAVVVVVVVIVVVIVIVAVAAIVELVADIVVVLILRVALVVTNNIVSFSLHNTLLQNFLVAPLDTRHWAIDTLCQNQSHWHLSNRGFRCSNGARGTTEPSKPGGAACC